MPRLASVEEQLGIIEHGGTVYQFSGCQYAPHHNCELNVNNH